ncbi:MAG: PGF-CTERM sorting domain-containing protein [Halanaeroarchaeum sp.]
MKPAFIPSLSTVSAVALSLLLLSSTGVAATGTVAASQDAPEGDDVQFARTVEEMKGYFAVSMAHARANESDRAVEYATAAKAEYWDTVAPRIEAANSSLAATVNDTLSAAPDKAASMAPDEYAQFVRTELFPVLDRATAAVVGTNTSTATFNAYVIAGLLERVEAEYVEGVSENGTIVERSDYDAARGFAMRSEALYREYVRDTLSQHARDELDELFEMLSSGLTDSVAPSDLQGTITSIVAELAEYTGLESESTGSAAAIERIEADLQRVLELYENGEHARAKALVEQTYLSNFEGVEGTLIEENPQLVAELEAAFNEDLPRLIERNVSVERIRERIETMETKLETAEEILASQETTEITLGDDSTTTEATTTVGTTETTTPGFGSVAGLVAVLVAVILARQR